MRLHLLLWASRLCRPRIQLFARPFAQQQTRGLKLLHATTSKYLLGKHSLLKFEDIKFNNQHTIKFLQTVPQIKKKRPNRGKGGRLSKSGTEGGTSNEAGLVDTSRPKLQPVDSVEAQETVLQGSEIESSTDSVLPKAQPADTAKFSESETEGFDQKASPKIPPEVALPLFETDIKTLLEKGYIPHGNVLIPSKKAPGSFESTPLKIPRTPESMEEHIAREARKENSKHKGKNREIHFTDNPDATDYFLHMMAKAYIWLVRGTCVTIHVRLQKETKLPLTPENLAQEMEKFPHLHPDVLLAAMPPLCHIMINTQTNWRQFVFTIGTKNHLEITKELYKRRQILQKYEVDPDTGRHIHGSLPDQIRPATTVQAQKQREVEIMNQKANAKRRRELEEKKWEEKKVARKAELRASLGLREDEEVIDESDFELEKALRDSKNTRKKAWKSAF